MSALRSSLQTLLDAAPSGRGGFVVFSQGREFQYVQFSLEPLGLVLNWPTIQAGGTEALPAFVAVVEDFGFAEAAAGTSVQALAANRYVVVDDGLYAQTGRAVGLAEAIAKAAFERVFGSYDESALTVDLSTEG